MLVRDVLVEPRVLVEAEKACHPTFHPADHAADDGAHRAGGSLALLGAARRAARHALGMRGDAQCGDKRCGCSRTHKAISNNPNRHDLSPILESPEDKALRLDWFRPLRRPME
jgi:hypothetical protein